MPDDEGNVQWQPPRGRVFKVIVWLLLTLIALGIVAGLVVGLMM